VTLLVKCNFRSIRGNCRGLAQYVNGLQGFLLLKGNDVVEGAVGGVPAVESFSYDSTSRPLPNLVLQPAPLSPPHSPALVCRMDHPLYSYAQSTETGCDVAYKGRFCTVCSQGHAVSADGACDVCPKDHPTLFVFAVIMVLTGLKLMLNLFVKRRESQSMLLSWMQNVATLFHWTWPMPSASRTVLTCLALFNFNVNILPWACFGMGTSWTLTTAFLASVPLMSTCCIALGMIAFRKYVYIRTERGSSLLSLLPRHWLQSSSRFDSVQSIAASRANSPPECREYHVRDASRVSHAQDKRDGEALSPDTGTTLDIWTMKIEEEWEQRLEDEAVRLAIVVCDFMFVPSSLATMQLLNCRFMADETVMQRVREFGKHIYHVPRADLTSYPSFECWTTSHIGFFILGLILATFIFGVYPCFVGYQLGLSFLDERMLEVKTMRRFGDLYLVYEKKYWWWYFVVLIRRFILVLNATVLHPTRGYFQIFSGLVVSGLSVAVSGLLRPYKDNRFNYYDMILHGLSLVMIATAVANSMSVVVARSCYATCWHRLQSYSNVYQGAK
jgi:hypothetical protein